METCIVREYGNGVLGPKDATLESPEVRDILEHDMGKFQKLLDYLKVVHYVEPLHLVEGPQDRLSRNKNFGWYGRVAAPGYDAFAEHFRCNQEHIPFNVTLGFIWKLIKRWFIKSLKRKESAW